jgi:CRP-like cAMP-binding protein
MITLEDLRAISLFRGLPDDQLHALLSVVTEQAFAPGQILFEKDMPGDCMYVVRSGHIRIFMRDDDGNQITFRQYGPGQIVGEFALIDGQPRSASAEAVDALSVLVLQRDAFLRLLRDRPRLGVEMMRGFAERARYTTQFLERLYHAIQLLSNHEYERAVQEMALSATDAEMQQLITTFLDMVRRVSERDAALNATMRKARIEIDPHE